LVILGSLLGNSFVAGRMTVAASNARWIPRILGTVGHLGRFKLSSASKFSGITDEVNVDREAEVEEGGDAPINAVLLSALLASIYILFGNMRILLTLNGLAEYAFFFLTVVGAIILRFRDPSLARPVKPFIGIPVVFALISGFVVVRGAVFAPAQAGVLVGVWVVGAGWYVARGIWEGRRNN
jgi:solute carrier family 7 (L-type amino acid transporter), member 9/15